MSQATRATTAAQSSVTSGETAGPRDDEHRASRLARLAGSPGSPGSPLRSPWPVLSHAPPAHGPGRADAVHLVASAGAAPVTRRLPGRAAHRPPQVRGRGLRAGLAPGSPDARRDARVSRVAPRRLLGHATRRESVVSGVDQGRFETTTGPSCRSSASRRPRPRTAETRSTRASNLRATSIDGTTTVSRPGQDTAANGRQSPTQAGVRARRECATGSRAADRRCNARRHAKAQT
jgi:hypothetical protein